MTSLRGMRAQKAGEILENQVETILESHNYLQVCSQVPKKQKREFILNSFLPKRYAKQVFIGSGIYQTDIYVDFYIVGLPKMPSGLIIECKWQESVGSVDEKLPYLNLNIQDSYPAPAIIVIGGEGMRNGAIEWLKKQESKNSNLLGVQSLERFIAWAGRYL